MLRPLCLSLVLASCAATPPLPFGLAAPGESAEVFAPGVVTTEGRVELNGALSPDGREFFFTRILDDGRFVMHCARFVDGQWTDPEPVQAFVDDIGETAVDMTYSPDGHTLTFLGRAPGGVGERPGLDLWQMQRAGDGWAPAAVLPPPVSTEHVEIYPCMVADGSLYFSSRRPDGLGEYDVYRAQRRPDGSFDEPVNLGTPVNSEYSEGDAWVSPDESVLVVTSRRPGGFGSSDLWVHRREADGSWSEPVNLGPGVNTEGVEYCPMGTWDGRAFFFSRRNGESWDETTEGTVHWIGVQAIDRAR